MLDEVRGSMSYTPSVHDNVKMLSVDMDMALDNVVPETLDWRHIDEGPEYVHHRHKTE
jgi:hypothetical protein